MTDKQRELMYIFQLTDNKRASVFTFPFRVINTSREHEADVTLK